MIRRLFLLAVLLPAPAMANPPNTGPDREVINVNMRVPALCVLGNVGTGSNATFDLGVLSERATGFLRRDLAPERKRLIASFCNSPSVIRIEASPMTVVGNTRAQPNGFARRIHYLATATGWTDLPATYQTSGATTQPNAERAQPNPRESDILVALSDFETDGGSNLRPIAGSYAGQVTVTLGPRS